VLEGGSNRFLTLSLERKHREQEIQQVLFRLVETGLSGLALDLLQITLSGIIADHIAQEMHGMELPARPMHTGSLASSLNQHNDRVSLGSAVACHTA
jgi:hypothetical protein